MSRSQFGQTRPTSPAIPAALARWIQVGAALGRPRRNRGVIDEVSVRTEKLDCYALAVEVSHWFHQTSFPRGRAELRKQGQDAADSVVLNIAEGAGRRKGATDAGKNHHEIAMGSAAECCAVLDLVRWLKGADQQQDKLRRIGAMLAKLSR